MLNSSTYSTYFSNYSDIQDEDEVICIGFEDLKVDGKVVYNILFYIFSGLFKEFNPNLISDVIMAACYFKCESLVKMVL